MLKAVLPEEVCRWLGSQKRLLKQMSVRLIGPGGQSWVARYLDQRAARRVLLMAGSRGLRPIDRSLIKRF